MFQKNVLLDHKYTALEPKCEVAKNSPDGEKSIDIGALWNYTQSTKLPVNISHTLIHLSNDEQIIHFESGYEKQISVTLLVAAYSNTLTFFSPFLALSKVKVRSDDEKATKSFILLYTKLEMGYSLVNVLRCTFLQKSHYLIVQSKEPEMRHLFNESKPNPVISPL